MKCIWIQSAWEAHVSQHVYGAWCPDGAFNVLVDVFHIYIGVRLRLLFLLRFHKALCLLQFYFSCVSTNFSFKGIIGDPLTTFEFSMSICDSNLVCLTFFMLFYVALFVEYFWVRKFLLFLRMQLSFTDGVLVMMLQVVCGMFPGLGTSH